MDAWEFMARLKELLIENPRSTIDNDALLVKITGQDMLYEVLWVERGDGKYIVVVS